MNHQERSGVRGRLQGTEETDRLREERELLGVLAEEEPDRGPPGKKWSSKVAKQLYTIPTDGEVLWELISSRKTGIFHVFFVMFRTCCYENMRISASWKSDQKLGRETGEFTQSARSSSVLEALFYHVCAGLFTVREVGDGLYG